MIDLYRDNIYNIHIFKAIKTNSDTGCGIIREIASLCNNDNDGQQYRRLYYWGLLFVECCIVPFL